MTARKKQERTPPVVEGPFTFRVGETAHKVKIGVTVPPLAVLYMDKAVEAGFFANRSDFVTQAMLFYIERKKEEIEFDKMLALEVSQFYEFIFKEHSAKED
jgi:Arc/MetJ-type ribon-helix-helix transcriptional regulator